MPAASAVVVLLLAAWIDRTCGEPPAALHPVVWIGRYLSWVGRLIRRGSAAAAFVGGVIAWLLGAGVVVVATTWLQSAVLGLSWWWLPFGLLGAACLLKTLFAWAMLRDEARAVERALEHSLIDGRSRLARLVSRDTSQLSAVEVRESVIESLAENLNDSVIAPVFWFVCFGLPGAALYRFANTADAMWGYRGEWEWAGKWAAWADDLLSWLPARITAVLLAWCGRLADWLGLPGQARLTPSPNSGWPMAAMALCLGLRLRKPGVYVLNPDGADAAPSDVERAIVIARSAARCAALLACVGLIGSASW